MIYKGCDYYSKQHSQHANKRPVAQRYTPHLTELPAISNHHSRNYAQALRGEGPMPAVPNTYICFFFSVFQGRKRMFMSIMEVIYNIRGTIV